MEGLLTVPLVNVADGGICCWFAVAPGTAGVVYVVRIFFLHEGWKEVLVDVAGWECGF